MHIDFDQNCLLTRNPALQLRPSAGSKKRPLGRVDSFTMTDPT